jgi:predicted ATPase
MITSIRVDNFKSLKNVDIALGRMNFLVGPNASGKSTFAEVLDFISHAVRENLPYAMADKGGFYNICHRRQRRARGAISFGVTGEVRIPQSVSCIFDWAFQIRTRGQDIRADFYVASEALHVEYQHAEESIIATIERNNPNGEPTYKLQTSPSLDVEPSSRGLKRVVAELRVVRDFMSADTVDSQNLILSSYIRNRLPIRSIVRELSGVRVFQFNPRIARQPAAPSIHGELGRRGENLASAVDYMRLHERQRFELLLSWLKDVVPTISRVLTSYTDTRQLGLFFEEEGFGASWVAEDISDGTIMSIALFFALLDPRHRVVVIEEPENALHPWILRRFLDRCKDIAEEKQIIVTTHSPLLIAKCKPSELLLAERFGGMSSIVRALDREPQLNEIIRSELLTLGDYWLSAGLGAVPSTPEVNQKELFGNDRDS